MSKKKHVYNQRWKIISTIDDKSGQAFIYKVSDITGEYKGEFALKRIKNVKREERYNNEVAACLKLRHENVIEIIEHFKEEDYLCMVFPYYNLGNLETYIHEKDLVLDKIIEFALQIANALNNAHENGIIHRDIKPQNILVKDENTVIVADFGICLIEEKMRNTMTFENVGARWYMAPELEEWGQLDVKPSADIYSLGKLIYYMLFKRLFPREDHRKAAYNEFQNGNNIVKELGYLVDLMVCDISIRIDTMQKVIEKLTKIKDMLQNTNVQLSENVLNKLRKFKDDSLIKETISKKNKEVKSVMKAKLDRHLEALRFIISDWFDNYNIEIEKNYKNMMFNMSIFSNVSDSFKFYGKTYIRCLTGVFTFGESMKESSLYFNIYQNPEYDREYYDDENFYLKEGCFNFLILFKYNDTGLDDPLFLANSLYVDILQDSRKRGLLSETVVSNFNNPQDKEIILNFNYKDTDWPEPIEEIKKTFDEAFELSLEIFDNRKK